MAGRGERRRRGALERQVLSCLAVATGPMTAAEVQAALGADLAYTTVMTTLVRLHGKRALTRQVAGRAYRYALAGNASEIAANVTAHQMLQLLAGTDRAEVFSRFVADLDPGDEALLAKLLQKEPTAEREVLPTSATPPATNQRRSTA